MIKFVDMRGRQVIFVLILTFVLMMTVGGVVSAEMMMDKDGMMMHNCPFMGIAVLCEMSPLQHLMEWQSMFTASAQPLAVILLLLLVLAIALSQFLTRILMDRLHERPAPVFRYRYRQPVFDTLRLALARGIIHPKVYER